MWKIAVTNCVQVVAGTVLRYHIQIKLLFYFKRFCRLVIPKFITAAVTLDPKEIMASSVFFRFKSQKEPSRVAFDGTGISAFELKREIILMNELGTGTDFELVISSEDTSEGQSRP